MFCLQKGLGTSLRTHILVHVESVRPEQTRRGFQSSFFYLRSQTDPFSGHPESFVTQREGLPVIDLIYERLICSTRGWESETLSVLNRSLSEKVRSKLFFSLKIYLYSFVNISLYSLPLNLLRRENHPQDFDVYCTWFRFS